MQSTFWTNTIWYLALLVTSFLSVLITMRKAKSRRFTAVFTASVLGLVYLLEYIIVVWLDSYSYTPKIIVNDFFQDTVFGNFSLRYPYRRRLLY